MSETTREKLEHAVTEVNQASQNNCTTESEQSRAFKALFSEGQKICFQERLDSLPIFLTFPFEASPDGTQFFVLNPFAEYARKREGAAVLYRQGFTIEQDTVSLNLQRVNIQ